MNPLFEALFAADHIAGKGGMISMPAPAVDGVKVSINDLATKLLAYGFLRAQEAGALDLTLESKKILFVTHKFVVTKRGATPVDMENRMINGWLQNVVDGKTVKDAVVAWFREDQNNPYAIVVQDVLQEAIAAGYMTPMKQNIVGKVGNLFGALAKAERVPEKTAEMQPIRQIGVERWEKWKAADPALVDEVVKQCSAALASRTKREDLSDTLDRIGD